MCSVEKYVIYLLETGKAFCMFQSYTFFSSLNFDSRIHSKKDLLIHEKIRNFSVFKS